MPRSNGVSSSDHQRDSDEQDSDNENYRTTMSMKLRSNRSSKNTVKNSAKSSKKNSEKISSNKSNDKKNEKKNSKKLKTDKNNDVLKVNQTINKHSKTILDNCNIVNYYRSSEMGLSCSKYKKSLKNSIINYVKTFKLRDIHSPFDRRVTYLVWHHTNPRLLAVASHGGDIILYNCDQDYESASFIKGIGAGGSIQV